jgi:hypothetical protein
MGSPGGKRRAPSSGANWLWRRFAIRLIAVCVLGVLAGAGWLVLQPKPARTLTGYGKPISDADSLLRQTETAMRRLVRARHGELLRDSRCYFTSQPDGNVPADGTPADGTPAGDVPAGNTPATGDPRSDGETAIGDQMLCGPVRLVDSDPSRPYLAYNLVGTPTPDGRLTLSVSSSDGATVSADPRPDYQLVRPDGAQPPTRFSFKSPTPPPAVGDVLTTTSMLRTPIAPAPSSAVMVGQLSGVRLVEYGFVNVYGWGDEARTAPAGYRLLAFATQPVPGEWADGNPDLSVRVDGRERGPLTLTSDYVVTAVPRRARQVDLVLTDSGLKQSISLLTGKPAAANPSVTVRTHDRQRLNLTRPIRVRLQTSAGTGELTGTLTLRQVSLSYWAADGDCPRPDRAWLHVGAVLQLAGDRQPYGAEPALLSVSVPGAGRRTTANAAANPVTGVDDVVEVPASFTEGNLIFAGTARTAKGTLTVLTPVTIPVAIPPG